MDSPDSWIVEVEIGATTLEKGLLAFCKVKYKFICSVSPEILLLGIFPEVSAYVRLFLDVLQQPPKWELPKFTYRGPWIERPGRVHTANTARSKGRSDMQ